MKFFSPFLLGSLVMVISISLKAQTRIKGQVVDAKGEALPFANIYFKNSTEGTTSDQEGNFSFVSDFSGERELVISYVGYLSKSLLVDLDQKKEFVLSITLDASPELEEVVVTATMKEMTRSESPVPVEVYNPTFFKKNPTPSLYECMNNVNGVRPQLNCNVCNTGDIHINGLEGPYTMVMIDGMPIVSGLSTVYGLMGIPNSMIERVEVVKGPASTLYGAEAIGGLINVITKDPENHPVFFGEVMSTSWLENQADLGFKKSLGKKVDVLTGIHLFSYQNPLDNNGDNFTDLTLSNRFSLFQKWNVNRRHNRLFTLGGRIYSEDRWGGEMQWNKKFRGSDEIYGESISTRRLEFFSKYRLPVHERITLWTSYNRHVQDSYYGNLPFNAEQQTYFAQLVWDKKLGSHALLTGVTARQNFYDDNTVATDESYGNSAQDYFLPGIFIQDEIELNASSTLLAGMRYDEHEIHGSILSPRLAYKWKLNDKNIFRINAGTGFRVVNVFTEDHAALTGARTVLVLENLEAEKSINYNLNYLKKIYTDRGDYIGLDMSLFYSHFSNKIIADYDEDPNLILYQNLDGYAVSQGFTLNFDALIRKKWRIMAGLTYSDVFSHEKDDAGDYVKVQPVLTEKWSATWSITYTLNEKISFDYTASLYGPMRLPLLGPLDPRPANSPWWSLQNIQCTYTSKKENWEVFGGVKNLLNYLPPANSIARAHDPFDQEVEFDGEGNVVPTTENPYALTFDPSYVYAPNQGIRFFLGFRYRIF